MPHAFLQPLTKTLTKTQIEVVKLVALGIKNEEIGKRLFIQKRGVESHLHNIFIASGINELPYISRYTKRVVLALKWNAENTSKFALAKGFIRFANHQAECAGQLHYGHECECGFSEALKLAHEIIPAHFNMQNGHTQAAQGALAPVRRI